MEIRYPYLIIIIIILFIVYYLFFRKNTSKFLKGIKITNTSFLKDTDYFKYKVNNRVEFSTNKPVRLSSSFKFTKLYE